MPLPSSRDTSSQGMTRCSTSEPGPSSSNGPWYRSPTRSEPLTVRTNVVVRVARDRDPLADLAKPVVRIGLDGGRDVRGQRPRGRRPDDERLAGMVEEWEANVERRVGALLVDAALRQLVLRDRRPAARAPLGRAVALVEVTALVHLAQEPPDVLDVGVREGEVVASPVHPLAETNGSFGERARGPHDHVAATARELGQAVLLDLSLRVQPELALDADLDPEALAVEPVLIPLMEPPHGLVALEDVLERPSPGRVHTENHSVRGDGPVDEAEPRPPGVLLPQPGERLLALPEIEKLELERVVIRLVRQRCEDRRHEESV